MKLASIEVATACSS